MDYILLFLEAYIMIYKSIFIFLALILVSHGALSRAFSVDPKTSNQQTQAKAVMSNVYRSFVKVIPYIYSSSEKVEILKTLSHKKEKEALIKNLIDLSSFFKSARHTNFFQRPGFRPSLETINEHLDETIILLNSNNFLFAQKRLNAMTSLCVSCHSQLSDSMSKNSFGAAIKQEGRNRFESDYAYANYLFLVRRFSESKIYFEKAIENSLNKDTLFAKNEINSSLQKMITIDTKIKFNYKIAQDLLAKYEKDQRIPSLTKATLQQWSHSLIAWRDFDINSVKSIKDFISLHLTPIETKKEKVEIGQEDMTLLISSGVLSNYLADNSLTNQTPEILYWLSIAERRLSQTYFFSLSDLYLKDCIKRYPSSPIAKKCYQEYADNLEAGYSGSAGTVIPQEEKTELLKLKALLK